MNFFNICLTAFKKLDLELLTQDSNSSKFCKMIIKKCDIGSFFIITKLSFVGYCRYDGIKQVFNLQQIINLALNDIQKQCITYNFKLNIGSAEIEDIKIKEHSYLKKCTFNCVLKSTNHIFENISNTTEQDYTSSNITE